MLIEYQFAKTLCYVKNYEKKIFNKFSEYHPAMGCSGSGSGSGSGFLHGAWEAERPEVWFANIS
jgi:hypothetical protein